MYFRDSRRSKTLGKILKSKTKSANTYKNILCMAEYIVAYFAV